MAKRATSFILAVMLVWSSVTAPARAFAPVAVLAAPQIVAVGGEVYAMAAMAGMVGITGLYSLVEDSSGNQVRVPLSDSPEAQPAPPVAPATATPVGGYTPAAPYCQWKTQDQPGGTATTCAQCAADWLCYTCAGRDTGWCKELDANLVPTGDGFANKPSPPVGAVVPNWHDSSPGGCPNGYGYASNQCTLSDARAVTPDQKIDYKRENGQLVSASALDVDKAAAPVHGNQNGVVSWAGKTIYGEPTQSIHTVNPNGSSQIYTQIQRSDGTLETQRLTFSPSGQVVEFATSQTAASLNLNPDTGTATVVAPAPILNPDGTVNTSVQPSTQPQQTIQFPNDYNRESTQQDIATKTASIRDKLTDSQTIDDPVIPVSTGMDDSFFKDTFTNLLAWQLPAHPSQCPAPSFEWNGDTYTINSHCQLVQDHFST